MKTFTPRLALVGLLLLTPLSAASDRTDIADKIDAQLERLMELELTPGVAVAVVRGDEVVFLKGFGYADVEAKRPFTPDSVFYIASSTKSFVGLAAAMFDHGGRIDLDAPISRYLTGAAFHDEIDPDLITMRQLLTHTHGISGGGPVTFRTAYSGQHTPELLRELLKYHEPARDGRAMKYSNLGFNVASLAMDETVGMSWKDVLQKGLFEPLGMDSTTGYASRVDPERRVRPYQWKSESGFTVRNYSKADSNMHAAGGLMTTASDLTQWLKLNINAGRVDGKQIIPAAVMAEAHTSYAEQDNSFAGVSNGPVTRWAGTPESSEVS